MQNYLDLLRTVYYCGVRKEDRTGTGTFSVFGTHLRFDLQQGFPLLTTKKLHVKSIIHELLWFLSGDTNIRYLTDNGVTIWSAWADDAGELGPVYGRQWRVWPTPDGGHIDQLAQLVEQIRKAPDSRRHLVSAWNVAELGKMALPPCHYAFQFYVDGRRLSCMFTMRSADIFLGLPFNIASYALLTHMIAQQCDLDVGELIFSGGDTHLYLNHLEQARLQLSRTPFPLPQLIIRREPDSLFEYRYDDFVIVGYESHPAIRAQISV